MMDKNLKALLSQTLMQPPNSTVIPQTISRPSTSTAPVSTSNPQSAIVHVVPPTSKAESGPVPVIRNVVCSVNLVCPLDLRKITVRTRYSEYNPSRFCGAVMRIRDPRATALVFSTGKIVVTGASSEGNARLAARVVARIIQKLGFQVKFKDFQIHNIVSTCDFRVPIRLESLNHIHAQFSRYEPELFPALIYRMVYPRVVLLIFVNGKVVITGAKSKEEIQVALDNFSPILRSFRKQ